MTLDLDLDRYFCGRILSVRKGEADLTARYIDFVSGRIAANDTHLPSPANEGIPFVVSGLVETFKDVAAANLFESQYDVQVSPFGMTGSTMSLSVVGGLPFLMFGNSSAIQIPLGRQESTEKLLNAPFLERIIATIYMDMIDNKNDQTCVSAGEVATSLMVLSRWYSRLGRTMSDLLKDAREGVAAGWLRGTSLWDDDGNSFTRYTLESPTFSWHLSLDEGRSE